MAKLQEVFGDDALYHFVRYNANALSIFINEEIYFAPMHAQNDPFETEFEIRNMEVDIDELLTFVNGSYCNETKLKLKEELFKNEQYKKSLVEELVRRTVIDHSGIFCCSKRADKVKMWSHYTEDCTGFVIVFNKKSLTDLKDPITHLPVRCKSIDYNGIPNIDVQMKQNLWNYGHDSIVFSKTESWFEEEEIRFYRNIPNESCSRSVAFDLSGILGIIFLSKVSAPGSMKTIRNVLHFKKDKLRHDFKWVVANLNGGTVEELDFMVEINGVQGLWCYRAC